MSNENMNNEDMITLVDDDGNELELAVLEYFLLDGQEYVLLSDMVATDENDSIDIFVMQVNILDDESEEFVNMETDKEEVVYAYAEKLVSGKVDEPSDFY